MLESAAKASASMLGTASNYRQSQTFTKVCLDQGAMINESCTPTPHSMRSDVDLHAASPVAQNKQGRVQDLGRGFCPISIIQSPQTSNFAASKRLRILQCNINGLCSTATKIKLEEIMEIAEKQKIQIIALQETKLNEKYNLKYKNYNILRKDRNKEGGGLAFLIKNLYYEDIAINIPNTSDLEAQGIKVYLSENKTINIFNMYHPPNNKLIDDGTMAQFLTDNTIIVGDLNAKHQLWGCSMPNPRGKILSNLFDDNAFMCLNDGNPTHHSYSYNTAQALDISFSSPDIFHKCKWQILKSIGSDHLPILIEISTKTKTSSIKEKFWNFKKANWNLYQQNTNEDFRKAPTSIKDLEQNWISFKNTIIKAAKVSIPRGNIKKWIPNYTHQAKDIQTLITKRDELQKSNSYQISSKIKFEIKDKKVEKKARKIIHDCKNITSTHNIFHEKINMKELDYALENTDLNKTPGPDGIHGQMISNLGKNGKERLLDIFNNSWKTGKLPQDWKTATIIPIKKLDKSADDPKNYRPISLTSICCKLMEKIILRRLTYHLDTKNLVPEEQYGFRKGHGTIDQLLFFTQKLKDAQNRKPTNHTIAAFLDLTQAFDKEYGKTKKISPCEPLQNVIFNASLNEPTNKQCQNPEYLKQLSLEIINNIPKNAITIYTDGSRDELGHTGSGCLIKTTNGIEKMNRRNPDFCSVFRSELIAIYEALKSIRNTNYQDIWILTDSRSAIQHLSHTGELRDKVSRNIIGYLQKLSKTSKIHFQWIPSHVGIEGNEAADVLAKKGTKEPLPQKNKLTFKEIETVAKTKINKNWRIPTKHSWYSGVNPGGALNIRNRQHQTTLTRFRTGHLKPLKIENNNKIYPTCPKCSLAPGAPEHILACIRCTKQDLWERPLLIIKQLEEHELMEFVKKMNTLSPPHSPRLFPDLPTFQPLQSVYLLLQGYKQPDGLDKMAMDAVETLLSFSQQQQHSTYFPMPHSPPMEEDEPYSPPHRGTVLFRVDDEGYHSASRPTTDDESCPNCHMTDDELEEDYDTQDSTFQRPSELER
ncbi:hypothetical protein LAZ67_17002943, partial [Cordylochernes scorpioides]